MNARVCCVVFQPKGLDGWTEVSSFRNVLIHCVGFSGFIDGSRVLVSPQAKDLPSFRRASPAGGTSNDIPFQSFEIPGRVSVTIRDKNWPEFRTAAFDHRHTHTHSCNPPRAYKHSILTPPSKKKAGNYQGLPGAPKH